MKKYISRLLLRNDRFLNLFHAFGLAEATSQSTEAELDCLSRHASARGDALEIGTRQGVSAVRILSRLQSNAKLYCVDPWLDRNGKRNWSYDICMRHFRRNGVADRVVLLRGFSQDMESRMPASFDFIFVDGDHSYQGIKTDWEIVGRRLRPGGIVCLHDTTQPKDAPGRTPDSCRFYREVITGDANFEHLETCYSLNVLQRRS